LNHLILNWEKLIKYFSSQMKFVLLFLLGLLAIATATDCVRGGCSGEICTDKQSQVVSICIWKEEFACYQTAICERQPDGKCGWRQTPELKECLKAARASL